MAASFQQTILFKIYQIKYSKKICLKSDTNCINYINKELISKTFKSYNKRQPSLICVNNTELVPTTKTTTYLTSVDKSAKS